MTEKETYSKEQIEQIISKYNLIFKDCLSEYVTYADIESRVYDKLGYLPFITSDFTQSLDQFDENEVKIIELRNRLEKKNQEGRIDNSNWEEVVKDEIRDLSELINETKIGTSIGLNKYADDLILNWNEKQTGVELVIIIGHDWYPLIGSDYTFESLFEVFPINKKENKYAQCLYDYSIEKNLVLLFNLIPGYRFPYSFTSGKFLEDQIYKRKAQELVRLINKLMRENKQFSKIKIVTWGNLVRDFIYPYFENSKDIFCLPHPSVYFKTHLQKAIQYYKFMKNME
ncbi:hypothetical protein [Leptospira stimsonii]|uniref:Uracil-DNA glycosylase-like domain-containing protein n=1 Tax=Leptospira stimsonii TaxID=2202203 RepID=A0ABY2N4R6_9LEPT|nr:hypothetical protein [Leptospira stimsonii]TGK23585.1 hypothetical protein EHO98_04975 [Leptospira stimsonii]TGM16930.1 hypothetical protein EHQ90_08510 [Leptospira stimsonii]